MTPQQRGVRSRRLTVVAAALVASAALACGPGFAAGAGVTRVADPPAPTPAVPAPPSTAPTPVPQAPVPLAPAPETPAPQNLVPQNPVPQPPAPVPPAPVPPAVTPAPGTSAGPGPTPTPPQRPAFGAYLDYGPLGVARMAQLSTWLGGAELRVGHTYLPGDRWSNIEGRPGFLDVWAHWRREKADRMLVLNVPMMERNEDGVSDADVRRLLRRGADGEFDQHFKALAERLVELDVPDTVLVLGWEMNGITYTHRCGPDPEAWKTYWNRIVTAMRSVPGQQFKFDFAPSRGRDAVPWPQCYPGDDAVDIVGMDSYDQPSGLTFDQQVKEPYGLQEHVEFAEKHGKAISYPEWGLFRNGDNATYMRGMLAWMDAHKPLYNTLTDYCPHGVWQCRQNPEASEVYRAVLSGRPAVPTLLPSTPAPSASAQPATPQPGTPQPAGQPVPQPSPSAAPARCSPLDLGDWVEYWLGGKLCVRLDWYSRRH
ncbi:glycoside hydrolase family 26 protein [Streptomyces longwoodensis]|uniref:glycoside hydrolase family 26 protein n=1 Tax=Streptomyces longwoodensis TaxID=68231 RepID=UPI0036FC9457